MATSKKDVETKGGFSTTLVFEAERTSRPPSRLLESARPQSRPTREQLEEKQRKAEAKRKAIVAEKVDRIIAISGRQSRAGRKGGEGDAAHKEGNPKDK